MSAFFSKKCYEGVSLILYRDFTFCVCFRPVFFFLSVMFGALNCTDIRPRKSIRGT